MGRQAAKSNIREVETQAIPVQNPQSEAPKSAVDTCTLPTGYLDAEGNLHTECEIRELTGEEEDILTSRKMPVYMRMNRVLENCVVRIGDYSQGGVQWRQIIRDLVVTDRLYLVIQLRIVSLGNLYSAKIRCEECDHVEDQTVDLDDFVVKGLGNPLERKWEGVLPKSQKSYIAKVQTGEDEVKVYKAGEKDILSLAIMCRLIELDGKAPVKMGMVKKLGFADRKYLRDDFMKHEGDIDKSIEFQCGNCGAENMVDIDIGSPNFFFPTETSNS